MDFVQHERGNCINNGTQIAIYKYEILWLVDVPQNPANKLNFFITY